MEEGSLSQDGQTCNRCRMYRTEQQNHSFQVASTEYLIQVNYVIYVKSVEPGGRLSRLKCQLYYYITYVNIHIHWHKLVQTKGQVKPSLPVHFILTATLWQFLCAFVQIQQKHSEVIGALKMFQDGVQGARDQTTVQCQTQTLERLGQSIANYLVIINRLQIQVMHLDMNILHC